MNRATLPQRLLWVVLCVLPGCEGKPGQSPEADAPRSPAPRQRVVTKTGAEMVLIPAGEFAMGDARGEDDEQPVHRVRVGSFWMDKCEVTQGSFERLAGRNPARWVGLERPVERVTWFMAIQYCNLRSVREGLRPCYDPNTQRCDFGANGYRLPTEAEWEYACRAGSTTRWSFGDEPSELSRHAWFKQNAGKGTHPVKQKAENPWGLYDMYGNVAEWCHDFYRETYPAEAALDPHGPDSGQQRVLRGGSWNTREDSCRSGARRAETPAFADACFGSDTYGFRCVRRAEQAVGHAERSESPLQSTPAAN